MKVLAITTDFTGCFLFRIKQPFDNLKRVDPEFEYTAMPFLPRNPSLKDDHSLIYMISGFDLVVLQRCFVYSIAKRVKDACEFLGKPLVFETDDDYLHLEPHNPCYWGMVPPVELEKFNALSQDGFSDMAKLQFQTMETYRQQGLEEYKEIIKMMDAVTVSTEELKRTLYPYNKNIIVLQNNVDRVFYHKDLEPEENYRIIDQEGNTKIAIPQFPRAAYTAEGELIPSGGGVTIPAWCLLDEKFKTIKRVVRVGYSGTPSHRGKDFETISDSFNKVIEKHLNDTWTFYIGDPYFFHKQKAKGRKYGIHATEYDLYMFNMRNVDVGIAPLELTHFNMSKSDIKAVEHASWGAPCILPRYVTYTRNFKDRETALFYSSKEEFADCLEELITNHKLREELGENAREYVKENRLEKLHSLRRYNFYKNVIDNSYPLKVFSPKEKEHESIAG